MVNEKLLLKNYNPKLFKRLKELGCEFEEVALVEPAEIVVDQGIYPRSFTDTDRVEMYREDVLKGDRFPPLIVTRKEGKLLLIDGNHRYFAHLKAGVKVPVEIWKVPGHKIRYVATICNVLGRGKAGKDLTGSEKKKGIIYAFSEGINTVIEKLAEDFETTASYVRKVLSQAGLIKDRKEEMKKKARELREEGYSVREIAKKLSEEFGEEISYRSVARWLEGNVTKITQVKNDTPTVRSVLDDPEKLAEQEEKELLEAEEEEKQKPALWRDSNLLLSTVLYWVGECMPYLETGSSPEEAVELAGVHPNVREAVLTELKERLEKREQEIARWVEKCKSYIDAGFEPKKAVSEAGVPEEIKNAVVKKLVGYKNHLHQEEEKAFKAELGPVDSRRRDILIKAHQLTSIIQEIEHKLKDLDAVFLKDAEYEYDARRYGRDQYIRDYLTFILVRGGWDKAEWFREITKRWIRYTLHPSYAEEFIEDMKEQAKLSPEEWEEISIKYWEENLVSEAELRWKKFCESLGLPVLKEYGGTE